MKFYFSISRGCGDFLIFQGFVPSDNPYDEVPMHIGFPSDDKYAKLKANLLSKYVTHLNTSSFFNIG